MSANEDYLRVVWHVPLTLEQALQSLRGRIVEGHLKYRCNLEEPK